MSNIDKQALRIPERKKHNWGQAVMRDCDFCQQWALTVRHSDGGCICASCCDSEYTTALSIALVVALDELEAKDATIAFLQHEIRTLLVRLEAAEKTSAARLGAIDTTHKMFQRERDRADAAEKRSAELSQELLLVHNPCAQNPIPRGYLNVGREFWVEDDTLHQIDYNRST